MKISVVLATYNGEKYISEQMMSIYKQTYKVDEVIIVDDDSKDNTISIVNSFIKENGLDDSWFLYQNEENLGYRLNFKKAFSYATGDIVILSDQDDVWEEDKVEEFKYAFEQTDALAINTAFRFIDKEGKLIHSEENNNNNNLLRDNFLPREIKMIPLEAVLANNISPGCTMAVSRELVKTFLEVSEGIQPHDWELNIMAALDDRLYFYNKKLTRYRIHGENEIGMTTELDQKKPTPNLSYQQRCHNISERIKLKDLFECFTKYNLVSPKKQYVFEKLYRYDELRYGCVVEKKPYMWFVMTIYSLKIIEFRYVRLRELIGDFYFSLRK